MILSKQAAREGAVPVGAAVGRPRPSLVLAMAGLILVAPLLACSHVGPAPQAEAKKLSVPAEGSPEFFFLLARELEASGRYEDALSAYAKAAAADPGDAFLLRRAAELAGRQNNIEKALEFAERAYQVDPDHVGARVFLATAYRMTDRPEDAKRVLVDESGAPVSADAAVLLYGLLSDDGNLDEAMKVSQQLIELEPDGLRGYYALADLHDRRDEVEAAEAVLREALDRNPGELQLYGALARLFHDRELRDQEIAVYREILVHHPENPATMLALAESLSQAGGVGAEGDREAEANRLLSEVAELASGDLRITLRLGFLYFERGDYAQAADQFERALDASPGQHEVAYFTAVSRRRLREYDRALAIFESIPRDSERYAEARTQIASIFEDQGEFSEALRYVEEAREIAPTRPLDLYVASLRAKSGDFSGAVSFLESLLDETPEDAELLYNIGVIHGEADLDSDALHYMERVLEQEPDHPGALNYVGYTWVDEGRNLGQAEEYITRALEKRPEDGFITDSLGWLYYKKARPLMAQGQSADGVRYLEAAVRELQRAAELTGGDPVIAEHLGDVYLLMGDRERALDAYERAIELVPREREQPDLLDKHRKLLEELRNP